MADNTVNRIEIELPNGYKLVAEQNPDSGYNREMFVGIVDGDGVWHQDLAIVRNSYHYEGGRIVWDDNKFEVLVYGDSNNEDFTNKFAVDMYQEPQDL